MGSSIETLTSAVNVYGNVNAENFITASDIRLKENVETIENALSLVSSLRSVKYQLKDNINKNQWG